MNDPIQNIDQFLKQTLTPDYKVNFTTDSTAIIQDMINQKEFEFNGDFYTILIGIWHEWLNFNKNTLSLIVFDQYQKIKCNGQFTVSSTFEMNQKLKISKDQVHFIVDDCTTNTIHYYICIDDIVYRGNITLDITNTKKAYFSTYHFLCSTNLDNLEAITVFILMGSHEASNKVYTPTIDVVIHHINSEIYSWDFCHHTLHAS